MFTDNLIYLILKIAWQITAQLSHDMPDNDLHEEHASSKTNLSE